jgi:hypothetical protein
MRLHGNQWLHGFIVQQLVRFCNWQIVQCCRIETNVWRIVSADEKKEPEGSFFRFKQWCLFEFVLSANACNLAEQSLAR